MATPYTDVYDFFLSKVTDYSFIDTSIYETEQELHEELFKYLRSAIIRFPQSTVNLSNRDDVSFVEDLGDYEKEILSTYMVIAYITPKIVSVQNMEQKMSDREYKTYSEGKLLEQMIKLKKEMQLEVSHLVSQYTYTSVGIQNLN